MGLFGDIVGFLGGGSNSYQPQAASITPGVNSAQTGRAYTQGQTISGQQQDLWSRLVGQNAPGYQGSTLSNMQDYSSLLAGRAGAQNIDYSGANAYAPGLQGLATAATGNGINYGGAGAALGAGQMNLGQLAALSRGEGPNPALAQLAQTSGQNIQQATGMIASQKGVNPALAARTAAMTGANLNQQAAGQAATLQAQQQLGAMGQLGSQATSLGGLQAQMAQAAAAQQGQNIGQATGIIQGLQGNATTQAQNQAQLQQQYMAALGANLGQTGQLASEGVGQLLQAQGLMGGQNLQQQQILQAALANYNAQKTGMQENLNNVGAGVSAQNTQIGANLFGNLAGAAGTALALAHGGEVHQAAADEILGRHRGSGALVLHGHIHGAPGPAHMADGGPVQPSAMMKIGDAMKGLGSGVAGPPPSPMAEFQRFVAQPAIPPQLVYPGQFSRGGVERDYRSGGGVRAGPGEHAVVRGDSERNDRVPAMLSEGEAVIPRSKMADPKKAHDFLDHLLAKKGRGGKGAFHRYCAGGRS